VVRLAIMFLALLPLQPAWGADLVTSENDLEGAWSAIAAERDGAPAPELVGNRIEFTGDGFRISHDGKLLFGGRFTANETVVPAEIDLKVEEGAAKGQSWAGIFRIENGALTICDNAPNPAAPRQKDFTAPKGSGYVCLTFER
jgi:uncharacterized protein (TIGR03067 family)